jgi:hypothetical protein
MEVNNCVVINGLDQVLPTQVVKVFFDAVRQSFRGKKLYQVQERKIESTLFLRSFRYRGVGQRVNCSTHSYHWYCMKVSIRI